MSKESQVSPFLQGSFESRRRRTLAKFEGFKRHLSGDPQELRRIERTLSPAFRAEQKKRQMQDDADFITSMKALFGLAAVIKLGESAALALSGKPVDTAFPAVLPNLVSAAYLTGLTIESGVRGLAAHLRPHSEVNVGGAKNGVITQK